MSEWLMKYHDHGVLHISARERYRTALIINGLVTGIATYHYFRIFNSWNDAFDVKINSDNTGYNVKLSGQPFNDASAAAAPELCRLFRRNTHVRLMPQ